MTTYKRQKEKFKRLKNYLTLTDLSKILPGRPHASTCRRWGSRGIEGIRLETFMIGGKRCTTLQCVEEFIAAVSAKRNSRPAPHQAASDSCVSHDFSATQKGGFEQASRELDRRGI